jgi:8-oxo-dGTP pyrophosphatase MutT (NUDIX family)
VTEPLGVAVDVWRRSESSIQFLVLHRAIWGADFEGDWAWSTPGGGLDPGEDPRAGAGRELREETGLELELVATDCGPATTVVFSAEASADAAILLSPEHDRFDWLTPRQAGLRCLPGWANHHLACVARGLGHHDE